MDFHLTNEQLMLRKMYREFAENEVKPLAEELDEEERFPMNMEEYGNTSAASIPILLYEENRRGKLKKDSLLVLSGFGGGLTYGASLLRW